MSYRMFDPVWEILVQPVPYRRMQAVYYAVALANLSEFTF